MVKTRTRDYSLETVTDAAEERQSPSRNGKRLQRIAPTYISPLRARIPPTHSSFSEWYHLNCPTGEVSCCWAGGCMCEFTERCLRQLGELLDDDDSIGAHARYMFMDHFGGKNSMEFKEFEKLSIDDQHKEIVKKQIDQRRGVKLV